MNYYNLYRKSLKYITYVPANGYLWMDYDQEWHGPYETEEQAIIAFWKYLLNEIQRPTEGIV